MWECGCDEWARGICAFAEVIDYAEKYGGKFSGEKFQYCPWCGKELEPKAVHPPRMWGYCIKCGRQTEWMDTEDFKCQECV